MRPPLVETALLLSRKMRPEPPASLSDQRVMLVPWVDSVLAPLVTISPVAFNNSPAPLTCVVVVFPLTVIELPYTAMSPAAEMAAVATAPVPVIVTFPAFEAVCAPEIDSAPPVMSMLPFTEFAPETVRSEVLVERPMPR